MEDETSIELPFTDEEIETKYAGKLSKEINGPTYEVLAQVMKAIVNRKITTPASFKGHSGTSAIGCSYKAAAGYIYPLERGFIYIHKPPIHIRFEEISSVNFARGGGSTRSFDFEIELKNGVIHTFSSIEKEEYGSLYDFINAKKLRVKNTGKSDKPAYTGDDYGDSDNEGEPDAYLERVKREGKDRDEDGDSDSSTDEDFNPDAQESDVAEEFDSNPSTTESDDDDEEGGKSKEKKKKKEKKPKSAKTISEKPRKPKKAKKPDDGRPKRAASAYMIWFNEARDEIKSSNPGISFAEIGKKGGEIWKKMSSSDKSKYEEKAGKAKEEYMKAMKEFKESGGGAESSKSKSSPSKSSPSKSSSKKSSSTKKVTTPVKSGSFISKEFIESSDDSSLSESDKEKSKRKSKKTSSSDSTNKKRKNKSSSNESSEEEKPKSKKPSKSDSEEEEEEESSGSASDASDSD